MDPETQKRYEEEIEKLENIIQNDMVELKGEQENVIKDLSKITETLFQQSDEMENIRVRHGTQIGEVLKKQSETDSHIDTLNEGLATVTTLDSKISKAENDIQQQKDQCEKEHVDLHTTLSGIDIKSLRDAIVQDQRQELENRNAIAMSSELKSLIEISKLHFEDFDQNNKYVVTAIHETAGEKLNSQGCLILSGLPGEGKTFMALKLIPETNEQDHCLKLLDPTDWKHVDLSSNKFNTIFIDDMFGAGILDEELLRGWSRVLPDIEKAVQKKRIKVIITSRHYILNEAKESITRFSIFQEENVMALSSSDLTDAEKSRMIELYLNGTHKPFDKRFVKECVVSYNVTFTQLQLKDPENILHDPPLFECETVPVMIGFPKTVNLFAHNDQLFQKGPSFFRKPFAFFKTCIEELFRRRKHFLSLILIWSRPGQFLDLMDLESLDISDEIQKTAKDFDFRIKGKTKAHLRKSMKYHEGGFLRFNQKTGIYTFCHNVVSDMVGVVVGKDYPSAVLRNASEAFIIQYVTTDESKNDGFHIMLEEFRFKVLNAKICELLLKKPVATIHLDSFFLPRQNIKDNETSIKFGNELINASVVKHDCFENKSYVNTFLTSQEGKAVLSRPILILHGLFGRYGIDFGETEINVFLPSYALFHKSSKLLSAFLNSSFASSMDKKDEFLTISLLVATHRGMKDTIELLLTHGAKVNENAIYIAADNQHIDTLSYLLKHRDENYEEHSCIINKNSPLITASKKGLTESVKCLISHGVDVDYRNNRDLSALDKAIVYNQVDVCRILLAKGALVSRKTKRFKRTPLHIASDVGRTEVIELLLQHGATFLTKDYRGHLPIHCAAIRGNNDAVDVLLKRDISQATYRLKSFGSKSLIKGMDLFHIAVWKNNIGLIDLLYQNDVNPNIMDFYGRTPFYCAVYRGKTEFVQKLIGYSNIRQAEKNGFTPLHAAIHKNHTDIARLICPFADVNARDKYGKTPLHTACEQLNSMMFKTLIEDFNADVRMLTNKQLSVFGILKIQDVHVPLSVRSILRYMIERSDEIEENDIEEYDIEDFMNIVSNKDPEFASYCLREFEQGNEIECEAT